MEIESDKKKNINNWQSQWRQQTIEESFEHFAILQKKKQEGAFDFTEIRNQLYAEPDGTYIRVQRQNSLVFPDEKQAYINSKKQ